MKPAVQAETIEQEAARAPQPANPYARQQAPGLSAGEREQLILDHLPQVRLIARRIHAYVSYTYKLT